jgi:hypothetical protein
MVAQNGHDLMGKVDFRRRQRGHDGEKQEDSGDGGESAHREWLAYAGDPPDFSPVSGQEIRLLGASSGEMDKMRPGEGRRGFEGGFGSPEKPFAGLEMAT